ncbi:MAG: hypothetical protein JSW45_05515 [Thiotrichales bacterium]|nr:MAG: hypothetical protein JSW45_05515 [Thiotrichales bacterium]
MQSNQDEFKSKPVRRYAIRRVNPFLGVMQVVEADEGRALSCNGVVWEILVRAARGSTFNRLDRENKKNTYYRFGMWSMSDGLMKRASSPAADQDYFELASKCDKLVEYVRDGHHQLPFDLKDTLELWLFDRDNQRPIALLSSLIPGASLPSPEPRFWSSCIGANGSPAQRRFPQARDLETQVRQRGGFNIKKHWVKRLPDGSGVVEKTGSSIPADRFPVLLLDEDWVDDEEQRRAHEYIKWISPSLLTLQNLDKDTRSRLENNLNVQAISIEHHWHLYPEIIDQRLLKAARVQSKIEISSKRAVDGE